MKQYLKPVIMAGGDGKRLWPLSDKDCPKQFLKIFNNKSLIQITLERNRHFGRQSIITTAEYYQILNNQIKEINIEADIIVEPEGKSTAPCAIIAALAFQEPVLLIPADHYIQDEDLYRQTIEKAHAMLQPNEILTFGIPPLYPSEGYGYLYSDTEERSGVWNVEKFVEKPNAQDASEYIKNPHYYWNSGIFLFYPKTLIDIAQKLLPNIFTQTEYAFKNSFKENEIYFIHELYNEIEAKSLDIAIIEHAKNIKMLKAEFDWHDLGNWNSIFSILDKDQKGNFTLGNVAVYNTKNSYVRSEEKFTAVIGVSDVIVINTAKANLVVHKSKAEEVKHLLNNLENLKTKIS